MLVKAWGEHALDKSQCFKKFKSGYFGLRKTTEKFEDAELPAMLDEDDPNNSRIY